MSNVELKMDPDRATAAKSTHSGHKHARQPPGDTLAAPARRSAPAVEGAAYTCPMHPQIRRAEPGSCPICGMALEPLVPEAQSGPSPELRDFTRRFWIGTLLTLPVIAIEMGGHMTDLYRNFG
jgi:P-type Cu+ transporter